MAIELRPMSDVGGIEIIGVDVLRPLSTEVVTEIEAAFLEHGVLLFREQPMTAPQLVDFARHFGTLQAHVQRAYQHPDAPEVVNMTNRKPDGSFDEIGAARGALANLRDGWHPDLSYDPVPAKATLLHALEVTSSGGHTWFTNVNRAYEALPEELKRRLHGLEAEFVYGGHDRNKNTMTAAKSLDAAAQKASHATHPVVTAHPVTGKPGIYVNPLVATRIRDFAEADSEALLEELFDYIDRPEFHWSHRWSVGDTLMWENRSGIMHCGKLDYPLDEARRFIRTTVTGQPSIAYAA